MRKIRVIGDIHQKYDDYLDIINGEEYTVQLGDLGFRNELLNVDPNKHKWIKGNHDRHDKKYKNDLGRFGLCVHNNIEFFYCSGGFSIDKKRRTPGLDWFDNEELSVKESYECLELYSQIRPKVVITHEAPSFLVPEFTNVEMVRAFGLPDDFKSYTSQLLEEMYKIHQPELWLFGHYHRNWSKYVNKTLFVMVGECSYFDVWR